MIAERFASWIHDFSIETLGDKERRKASSFMLDFLGVALGGIAREDSARLAVADSLEAGGRHDATLFRSGGSRASSRVPSESAAFAHAVAGHSIEMDDVHNASSLHPAVVVIPSALAVGEERGASGRDVLEAVIAGYEVAIRLGEIGDPSLLYGRGFHPTAVCGVFASAASAAKLMGLGPEAIVDALGIAWSFAAGNMSFRAEGSHTKRLQVGNAARAGVHAARLASRGASGPSHVFEAHGFFENYSEDVDPSSLLDGLGEKLAEKLGTKLGGRLRIFDVGIKPYACCRYNQSPINALLELQKANGLDTDRIRSIDVEIASTGLGLVAQPLEAKRAPADPVEAQFSLPYSSAVALICASAGPDQYAEPWLSDKKVLALASRVSVGSSPEIDALFPAKWAARIRITMDDGTEIEAYTEACLGDPDKPMTDSALEDKFRLLTDSCFDRSACDEVIETIWNIDRLDRVSALPRKIAESLA